MENKIFDENKAEDISIDMFDEKLLAENWLSEDDNKAWKDL